MTGFFIMTVAMIYWPHISSISSSLERIVQLMEEGNDDGIC